VVTYQTAWLKAHFPTEFMAALLTVDSGNMDKVTEALEECRRMGIEVREPDVNHSDVDFSVDGEAIRFGLTSVKGVGRHAAESVVEARGEKAEPFKGVFDFCGRVDHRHANKLTLEALVKAGACDGLGGHRAQIVAALDPAIRAAASEQADRRAGQMSLLGGAAEASAPAPVLPDVPVWSEAEMLRLEKETTGRYWSSHPLAQFEKLVERFASHNTRTMRDCSDGRDVVVGGLLVGVEERIIRSGRNEGKRMARFRVEDFSGTVDAVMFSDAYARCRERLEENKVFFCVGDVDASREEICLRVNELIDPDDAPRELSGQIRIDVSDGVDLPALRALVDRSRGEHPVPVSLSLNPEPGLRVLIRAEDAIGVEPSPEFLAAAREIAGENAVQLLAVDPAAWRERRFGSRNGNGRRFNRRSS
jgi:DNA polymerase-3 subunit alpha